MKFCKTKTMAYVFLLAGFVFALGQGYTIAEETEQTGVIKKVYVKPSSEFAVRSGKGTEFKIVALVKNGTLLEVLEEEVYYARVKLSNEKEGWILKRFISEEPPADQLVSSLQREKEAFVKKEAETKRKLKELTTALDQTKSQLAEVLIERDKAVKDYSDLQSATGDEVQLMTDLEETITDNGQLSTQFAALKQENDALKKDQKLYWFLSGGGLLLLGVLLGRMLGSSRKRKSSLM